MGVIELLREISTKCWEIGVCVCVCDVAHVFDEVRVVVVEDLVAKGIDFPGENFDGVDVKVLQGQLGNTDAVEKGKMYEWLFGSNALQHGLDSGSVSWLALVVGLPFVALVAAFGWCWEWCVGGLRWCAIMVWWVRYRYRRFCLLLVRLVSWLVIPLGSLVFGLPPAFALLVLALVVTRVGKGYRRW